MINAFLATCSNARQTYGDEDPQLREPDPVQDVLPYAARLRGLISAGGRLAGVQPDPATMGSMYELQYMIVADLVPNGDVRISPEYLNADGTLKPAEELEKIWDNPGPASRRRIAEDVTLAGFESEFRGELPADHLLEDQPSTLE